MRFAKFIFTSVACLVYPLRGIVNVIKFLVMITQLQDLPAGLKPLAVCRQEKVAFETIKLHLSVVIIWTFSDYIFVVEGT